MLLPLYPLVAMSCLRKYAKKYEKGKLKEQRALPKDMRGKPAFRPSYVRCLHGLDQSDRIELLREVSYYTVPYKLVVI